VYGKIERADERAHVSRVYILVVSDELVHSERNDTGFYTSHADRNKNETVEYHDTKQQAIVIILISQRDITLIEHFLQWS